MGAMATITIELPEEENVLGQLFLRGIDHTIYRPEMMDRLKDVIHRHAVTRINRIRLEGQPCLILRELAAGRAQAERRIAGRGREGTRLAAIHGPNASEKSAVHHWMLALPARRARAAGPSCDQASSGVARRPPTPHPQRGCIFSPRSLRKRPSGLKFRAGSPVRAV